MTATEFAASQIERHDVDELAALAAEARKEHAACKEARAAGKELPHTPATDEIQRRYSEMTNTRKPKVQSEGSGRTKGRTDIVYFHDGKPMPGSHAHKLSTLAYFHSRNLVAGCDARCSTKEFVNVLVGLGVENPGEPGWIVELPNGITVECRVAGEASAFVADVKPSAQMTAARATAKARTKAALPESLKAGAELVKAPSKPRGKVAKQTPGGKARAARQVTPLPKKSPAKASKRTRKSA